MKKGYIFLIGIGLLLGSIAWGVYITKKHEETRNLDRKNQEINRQLEANGITLK